MDNFIHWLKTPNIGAPQIVQCGTNGIFNSKNSTFDALKITCEACKPCSHVLEYLTETREIAMTKFVSVEQIHCHSCSSIWDIP